MYAVRFVLRAFSLEPWTAINKIAPGYIQDTSYNARYPISILNLNFK